MITGYISISAQLVTGLVDVWGLSLPLPPHEKIYRELLMVELGVQLVELTYYVWLIRNIGRPDITVFRYYDWFLTTPLMLITLTAFIAPESSLKVFLKKNASVVSTFVVLNALMLVCGWKAEVDPFQKNQWISLGFLFWVLTFGYIFARFYPLSKNPLFLYYTIVWGMYGIAAIFPFKTKNNVYNILDLFSKNVLGIYLTYIIYKKSEVHQRQKLKNANQKDR